MRNGAYAYGPYGKAGTKTAQRPAAMSKAGHAARHSCSVFFAVRNACRPLFATAMSPAAVTFGCPPVTPAVVRTVRRSPTIVLLSFEYLFRANLMPGRRHAEDAVMPGRRDEAT